MAIKRRHSCSKTESVSQFQLCKNTEHLPEHLLRGERPQQQPTYTQITHTQTHTHPTRRRTEMDTVHTLTLPIHTLYLGPRPRRWSSSLWDEASRPAQSPQQQKSPPSQTLNGQQAPLPNLQPQTANKEQGCEKTPCLTPPAHIWCSCMVF